MRRRSKRSAKRKLVVEPHVVGRSAKNVSGVSDGRPDWIVSGRGVPPSGGAAMSSSERDFRRYDWSFPVGKPGAGKGVAAAVLLGVVCVAGTVVPVASAQQGTRPEAPLVAAPLPEVSTGGIIAAGEVPFDPAEMVSAGDVGAERGGGTRLDKFFSSILSEAMLPSISLADAVVAGVGGDELAAAYEDELDELSGGGDATESADETEEEPGVEFASRGPEANENGPLRSSDDADDFRSTSPGGGWSSPEETAPGSPEDHGDEQPVAEEDSPKGGPSEDLAGMGIPGRSPGRSDLAPESAEPAYELASHRLDGEPDGESPGAGSGSDEPANEAGDGFHIVPAREETYDDGPGGESLYEEGSGGEGASGEDGYHDEGGFGAAPEVVRETVPSSGTHEGVFGGGDASRDDPPEEVYRERPREVFESMDGADQETERAAWNYLEGDDGQVAVQRVFERTTRETGDLPGEKSRGEVPSEEDGNQAPGEMSEERKPPDDEPSASLRPHRPAPPVEEPPLRETPQDDAPPSDARNREDASPRDGSSPEDTPVPGRPEPRAPGSAARPEPRDGGESGAVDPGKPGFGSVERPVERLAGSAASDHGVSREETMIRVVSDGRHSVIERVPADGNPRRLHRGEMSFAEAIRLARDRYGGNPEGEYARLADSVPRERAQSLAAAAPASSYPTEVPTAAPARPDNPASSGRSLHEPRTGVVETAPNPDSVESGDGSAWHVRQPTAGQAAPQSAALERAATDRSAFEPPRTTVNGQTQHQVSYGSQAPAREPTEARPATIPQTSNAQPPAERRAERGEVEEAAYPQPSAARQTAVEEANQRAAYEQQAAVREPTIDPRPSWQTSTIPQNGGRHGPQAAPETVPRTAPEPALQTQAQPQPAPQTTPQPTSSPSLATQPAVSQPAAPQPTVPQPTVPQPTVPQPTVPQPALPQTTASQPTASEPTPAQPTVQQAPAPRTAAPSSSPAAQVVQPIGQPSVASGRSVSQVAQRTVSSTAEGGW